VTNSIKLVFTTDVVRFAGWQMSSLEILVIICVVLGLILFEAGPKALNFIKKRREGQPGSKG